MPKSKKKPTREKKTESGEAMAWAESSGSTFEDFAEIPRGEGRAAEVGVPAGRGEGESDPEEQQERAEAVALPSTQRKKRPALNEEILLDNLASLGRLSVQLHLGGEATRHGVLTDVNQVLLAYQKWSHDIFPHASLLDFVDKVQRLHSTAKFRRRLDDVRAQANPSYADSVFSLSSFQHLPATEQSTSSNLQSTTTTTEQTSTNASVENTSSILSSSSSFSQRQQPEQQQQQQLAEEEPSLLDGEDDFVLDEAFFSSSRSEGKATPSGHHRQVLSDDEE